MTTQYLIERLIDEKEYSLHGGIYHMLQIDMAYNSNHMEGSTLSYDETRYIFDTHITNADNVRVDDIIETTNHFRCFDFILDHYAEPLTESLIKDIHRQLKTGTFSSWSKAAVVGDYKKLPNYVGDIKTSSPKRVQKDLEDLLNSYHLLESRDLDDVLDFHANFEKIHPFYDGNGRVGRLIMFKECLANDIIPFVIRDEERPFYLRGMKGWQTGGERGYLRELCSSMQDEMLAKMSYLEIPYLSDNEMSDKIYISAETNDHIKNFISKDIDSFDELEP